jgi:drug/metabolite transporter (DMT)-like permease
MTPPPPGRRALDPAAFAALLLIACLFGANHVAARVAFNHGTDVATAVVVRSLGTALVVGALAALQRVPLAIAPRQGRMLGAIGALVAVQSVLLYSSVARVPVALALLAFNAYPICAALWAWALYRQRPARAVLIAMPVILCGLVLALDVTGSLGALADGGDKARAAAGVAFALAAAVAFGLVLVLTQHEVATLDSRLRTSLTMALVGVLALAPVAAQGGLHWPAAPAGWWGLVLLTVCYGTAFTAVFTLLPKLGVVGNSPILNAEPVAALVMAWVVLGQRMGALQVVGALVVVGAVMALGLRRR